MTKRPLNQPGSEKDCLDFFSSSVPRGKSQNGRSIHFKINNCVNDWLSDRMSKSKSAQISEVVSCHI